ncbi:MAG TPA: HD domain-containing protein [Methanomicrobia archaeon]|nr:HD domain-containing protein [Methanomicrobia archaeon]
METRDTMGNYKIIHDVVHGSIKLDEIMLDLAKTPELNRLHGIKQLGLVYLVFPGAHHTRFEHSLGVAHIASRIAHELKITEQEDTFVKAAGFLHDIGHGPFSHTLEYIFHDMLGIDHMQITKDIITGDYDIVGPTAHDTCDADPIPVILERYGLDPKEVADLVTGGDQSTDYPWSLRTSEDGQQFMNDRRYLPQIIHSPIDADQLDFLLRDSYYTGVAHGAVDLDRLLKTMEIHNNDLIVHRKGVVAVEGMLVARGLMYSSVYFHKTARIAEVMLSRAVESFVREAPSEEIPKMIDADLIKWMEAGSDYCKDIIERIRYRNLYKKAYIIGLEDLDEDQRTDLSALANQRERRRVEEEICRKAHIPEGNALIDIPAPELLVSEPRIAKTNVKILDDDNKVSSLSRFSPLASALRKRRVTDWAAMVFCNGKYKSQVSKVAEKLLE